MHNCSRGKQHIEISRFRFRFRRTAHFLGHAKLTRLRQYAPPGFFVEYPRVRPIFVQLLFFVLRTLVLRCGYLYGYYATNRQAQIYLDS